MFRSVAMHQVNIFVLEADIWRVTVALGRLGVLHLAHSVDSEQWQQDADQHWEKRVKKYKSIKGRIEKVMASLEVAPADAPASEANPSIDVEQFQKSQDEIGEIEEVIQHWDTQRQEIEEKIESLQLLQQETEEIAPLDVRVERLRAMQHLHVLVGTLPQKNLERLEMVLFRIPFVIVPLYKQAEKVYVFALSAKEDGAILDRALESALFDRLELPEGVSGPPDQVLEMLGERLDQARQQLDEFEHERERLAASYQERVLELWSRTANTVAVLETITDFGKHEKTYWITGWLPEADLNRLVETVDSTAEEKADVEALEAVADQQEIPVQLRNPVILRPFEKILAIFGLPAYDQVDPTPILALTFILMFGLMFGDVGHGLVLALIGLGLTLRSEGDAPALASVLVAAGMSGMLFGFMFGSLFGREDILPHLWVSPLEDVMTVLLFAVAAGVVVLNIGFILQMVSAWFSRDWGALLFGPNGLAGVALYWTLLAAGVMLARGIALPLIFMVVMLITASALIFLREPLAHWITGQRPLIAGKRSTYAVRGFFELFETVIAYFTNSVSFVRLGAFAVAHAALGRVVFIMADLSSGLGRWLIILIGSLILIGFEGMVVGIQALRLEYYEFFNRFFKGAGRPFEPFQLPEMDNAAR